MVKKHVAKLSSIRETLVLLENRNRKMFGPKNLACSAGVFFERAICSRHVETSRREEEMGPVLAPTVRVTISTLPNLPLS